MSLPVAANGEVSDERFLVRRICCVGRNYADHVRDMGGDSNRFYADIFHQVPRDDCELWGDNTVSEVRAAPDLRTARVYAAPLGGKNTPEVVAALNRCAKFLRGKLGRELKMRSTPALRFEIDTTFDTASEMNALLSRPEIARDTKRD